MMAAITITARFIARLCVAVAFALAVVIVPSVASHAAEPPVYPPTGGSAAAWKCTDTANNDTPPVTGQTCVVTAWEADPPAPEPAESSGPSEVMGTVELTEAQYQTLAFGLGLVVLLGGARLVGSWSR